MYALTGKSVIVTGGAAGIGKAIVCAVAARGAAAVIADRDLAAARALEGELRAHELKAFAVGADVSNSAGVAALMEETVRLCGRIDVVVNNAGILGDAEILDITDEAWRRMMSVDLDGVFYCCRESVRQMKRQGGGKIINIASAGGKLGFPYAGVHYCAAKGAVMALTRQLALQLGPEKIYVNCVAPGTTQTEMVRHRSEETIQYIRSHIPLGRMGSPMDTAAAVVLLAGDSAGFITGETIDVNGGLYMA